MYMALFNTFQLSFNHYLISVLLLFYKIKCNLNIYNVDILLHHYINRSKFGIYKSTDLLYIPHTDFFGCYNNKSLCVLHITAAPDFFYI